jgi:hypothetical protein
MAAIDDANNQFMADAAIVHQVVHGDDTTTVQTDGGEIKSLAKLLKDNQLVINNKLDADQVGAVNGVAQLDATGKVPAVQLPSYVDDVIESDTYAHLPATGESGKIYVVVADENHGGETTQYRWSGSAYAQIMAAPDTTDNVAEGVTNKYFTQARAIAAILAGLLTSDNSKVLASDSVLAAIGKLQAQLNTQPYDFTGFVGGKPANAALVMFVKVARAFTIPVNMAGSKVKAKTSATAQAVFTLYKNGTSFATLTFAAGGSVPSIVAAQATSFAIDDELTVVAPATADSTLADLAMTFVASLS